MMKYLKYILSIVCCVLIVSACDSIDFGSVNQDDDHVTQANTKSLMTAAMNEFFTAGGRNYVAKPTLYIQYQSQVTYTDEQVYNATPVGWATYYESMLNNLKRVIDVNSVDPVDPLTQSYGAAVNQIGVSQLMSAFIWKRLTDNYGPIPYEQALSDSTVTPAYSKQETIYKSLISKVKSARDMLDAGLQGPSGDVVYGGDVTKWKRFANSFLLSLTIQISKADPAYAKTEFNAALNNSAGVIETIDNEFWYIYQNTSGATNPLSGLRGADYQMGLPFTAALDGKSSSVMYNGAPVITYSNTRMDDRINVFAADPDKDGRPYGRRKLDPATNTPDGLSDSYTSISGAINGPDSPLPYMTAAYTYLNRAEAAMLGWTSENAQLMFETGVEKSYATVDAHWDDGSATTGNLQSDGTAYAAARLGDAPMAQLIGEEKWVALFPMGFQAWSEWRRTGYPGLVPAVEATNDGNIPTRYVYPSGEPGTNVASYNQGVSMLSPAEDTNTAKFWWEM